MIPNHIAEELYKAAKRCIEESSTDDKRYHEVQGDSVLVSRLVFQRLRETVARAGEFMTDWRP
jgi:hypothetical protein